MHTICPNCLRPVRAGAKYCGYCGTQLNSITEAKLAVPFADEGQVGGAAETTTSQLPGPTYDRTGRAVSFAAIVLLFLVIVVSLIIRFWPDILLWLGRIIPWMKPG